MTLWRTAKFDLRRRNRELKRLNEIDPRVYGMWGTLVRRGDVEELELVRLQLADLIEELGDHVVANMIREWHSCRKPKFKKRRK